MESGDSVIDRCRGGMACTESGDSVIDRGRGGGACTESGDSVIDRGRGGGATSGGAPVIVPVLTEGSELCLAEGGVLCVTGGGGAAGVAEGKETGSSAEVTSPAVVGFGIDGGALGLRAAAIGGELDFPGATGGAGGVEGRRGLAVGAAIGAAVDIGGGMAAVWLVGSGGGGGVRRPSGCPGVAVRAGRSPGP
jgi:hypothetical protein